MKTTESGAAVLKDSIRQRRQSGKLTEAILRLLKRIFNAPDAVKCILGKTPPSCPPREY